MIKGTLKVTNKLGLHARAAAQVVRAATAFQSGIRLGNGAREVSAKSIMGIMMLAATQHTELVLRVEGADEQEAYAAMQTLFQQRFGEEE